MNIEKSLSFLWNKQTFKMYVMGFGYIYLIVILLSGYNLILGLDTLKKSWKLGPALYMF